MGTGWQTRAAALRSCRVDTSHKVDSVNDCKRLCTRAQRALEPRGCRFVLEARRHEAIWQLDQGFWVRLGAVGAILTALADV
jgi:hypothetical protein